MRLILPFVAALCMPITAAAHPHIFVKAQVAVVFGADGDVAIQLDWEYDDLFSLLVTSDLGIDMDGDLVLTQDEQDLLDTEITAWPPEFAGDLEVSQAGQILPLLERLDHSMRYEAGLFTESHIRPVAAVPELAAPLEIRVFDPSFYTAYELVTPVEIVGRDDCSIEVVPADIDAAYALAADLLEGADPFDPDPAAYFPPIGDAFADRIVVTCAGR